MIRSKRLCLAPMTDLRRRTCRQTAGVCARTMCCALLLGLTAVAVVAQPHPVQQSEPQDHRRSDEAQPPRPGVEPLQILEEAVADARPIKYVPYRIGTFLNVAPVLQEHDPSAAERILDEAVALIPELRDRPPLKDAVISGLIGGVFLFVLGPPLGSPLRAFAEASLTQNYMSHYREEVLQYVELKDRFYLEAAELLAPSQPSSALELALSMKDGYVSSLVIDLAFSSWPKDDREGILAAIGRASSGTKKRFVDREVSPEVAPTPAQLGALAIAAGPLDPALSRELAHRAVDSVKKKTNPLGAERAYATLARFDPAALERVVERLSADPAGNAKRLSVLARGVAPIDPRQAWRALTAMNGQTDVDHLLVRAAILRQIVDDLPPELDAQAQDLALSLLASVPDYNPKVGTGLAMRKALRIAKTVSDAVVALGRIDSQLALDQAKDTAFGRYTGLWFLTGAGSVIEPDKKERRTQQMEFFSNLVRLDLVLSRGSADGSRTLELLESFDRGFWGALTYTTLNPSEFSELEFQGRMRRLLGDARQQWESLVVASVDRSVEESRGSVQRFLEFSEALDVAAVDSLPKKRNKLPQSWIDYLPFALTAAGRILHPVDPQAAKLAFEKSLALTEGLPAPAHEWSFCWNAAAWKRVDPDQAAQAVSRAAKLAMGLKDHTPWHSREKLTEFVSQLAQLDARTALAVARSKGTDNVRSYVLVAVLTGAMVDLEPGSDAQAPGEEVTAPSNSPGT